VLAAILLISAAWGALALWPLPDSTPAWVLRTREVCFGATRTGLPTPAGWLLLILEPLSLIGALLLIWGSEVRDGLAALWRSRTGKSLLLLGGGALAMGVALGAARVGAAAAGTTVEPFDPRGGTAERIDGLLPPLALVDQRGEQFTPARLGGRSAVVAFAYAHCATVCPTLIQDLVRARGSTDDPALVVVTLDPRRDVPSRLPAMAQAWGLGPEDVLLGGEVAAVESVAAGWRVPWRRDSLTGEITHGTPLYVLDRRGTPVWRVGGGDATTAIRLARSAGG
jgi:cytochrome oxidase Cu insertion factor (SCO1/SenC/PrrC family)